LLAAKKQNEKNLPEPEWKAMLTLGFSQKNNKTILSSREHYGPLVVQRPFYPEGDVCHVYLIHPPGGVVGGDKLNINIRLETATHVLMTTPSAGKFYRSGNLKGSQVQHLNVADKAMLEWFPQETIFFDGCQSELQTQINLTGDAIFCGWEISCLGRPASGESYLNGKIEQGLKLYRDNKPLFIERNEIEGSSSLLGASCGFDQKSVFATLLATHCNKKLCDELQAKWHERTEKSVSISLIGDVLICRYLGSSAEQAKKYFSEIWSAIRLEQKSIKICMPRIWYT